LLVHHHQNQIAHNEQLAEDVITKTNNLIIPEFISSTPDVMTTIENSIQKLVKKDSLTPPSSPSPSHPPITSEEEDKEDPDPIQEGAQHPPGRVGRPPSIKKLSI